MCQRMMHVIKIATKSLLFYKSLTIQDDCQPGPLIAATKIGWFETTSMVINMRIRAI